MVKWDDSKYGTREECGVDPNATELAGFQLGDRIIVIEDFKEDMYAYYEGEEGTVIGITTPTQGGGPFNLAARESQLFVDWDDTDPGPIGPSYVS